MRILFADGLPDADSVLVGHPKVVATRHIGASTCQAQEAVADGTAEGIEAYRTGSVINCVNLEQAPERTATLSVRHYDRVGVLAAVLEELRQRRLNVSTMHNRIFAGSVAAAAIIDVAGDLGGNLLDAVRALPDVVQVPVFEA